jgi:hypothetical protein
MSKVQVPQDVFDGIVAVRDSGLTNMLDRPMVARLAARMGFEATASWVRTHTKDYAEGVFHGFVSQEGS